MNRVPRVQIIDYRLGNLFSILQACQRAGLDAFLSDSPDTLTQVDGVILPGVGAFGNAMENLNSLGLIQPLKDVVASGTPLFGICLGMQLLFDESEEFGTHRGLGILRGKVSRLPDQVIDERRLRVPNVGWHRTCFADSAAELAIRKGMPDEQYLYYVHSYFVSPEEPSDILAFTRYGQFCYCSAVLHQNTLGVQFHPERSARPGLRFYENWAKMVRDHASMTGRRYVPDETNLKE